jgi:hypothetical protein
MSRRILLSFLFALLPALMSACVGMNPGPIPRDAILMAESTSATTRGANDFGAFTTTEEGTIYLYDVDGERMLYTGPIMAGETIKLLPEAATVAKPGATRAASSAVEEPKIAQYSVGHHIKLYFVPPGFPREFPASGIRSVPAAQPSASKP